MNIANARYAWKVVRSLQGQTPRTCTCCGYQGKFVAFGFPPRFDAKCSQCSSLERHRLFVHHANREGWFSKAHAVLHFAPEGVIRKYVSSKVGEYISADLSGRDVDVVQNMEKMTFEDARFDAVIASHVLEHVNDSLALAEIHRVLKPGGRLYCMVPIIEGWSETYENPSVKTELDRELHLRQIDHVRFYGADFRTRIAKAGFDVRDCDADVREVAAYGLMRGEKVFVATRT